MSGCRQSVVHTAPGGAAGGRGRARDASPRIARRRLTPGFAIAIALGAAFALGPVAAAQGDPHEHHHHVVPETTRTLRDYSLPAVSLTRDDGATVSLPAELNDARPVVLNFVYTTCTTVCPLTSQTFSELQRRLGPGRDAVHLMSISIDPEHDTPARLHAYAQKFAAGPTWQHYTGTVAASIASQRAFDVYRGDKMSHAPVTLVRTGPGSQWIRIEGFASPDQLLAELRPALTAR